MSLKLMFMDYLTDPTPKRWYWILARKSGVREVFKNTYIWANSVKTVKSEAEKLGLETKGRARLTTSP